MPSASSRSTLARQWEIFKRLPSRPPGITAADLTRSLAAEGFAVSKRTIERDLVELSRVFAIRCNDASIPFGWYWLAGREPEIPDLELPEALSICLAEQVLRASLPPPVLERFEAKFRHAGEKLKAARRTPHFRWRDKVRFVPPTQPFLPPKVRPGVLREIQNALLAEQILHADYCPFDAEQPKPLTLHPLALIHGGAVTYLVATAFEFQDVRQYALHRFQSARVGTEPSRRPRGFHVDSYIASGAMGFGDSGPIRLVAQVSDKLAGYLRETPISRNQTLERRKNLTLLKAEVNDNWQLRWWILSQSPEITVKKPSNLKNTLRNILSAASNAYGCT